MARSTVSGAFDAEERNNQRMNERPYGSCGAQLFERRKLLAQDDMKIRRVTLANVGPEHIDLNARYRDRVATSRSASPRYRRGGESRDPRASRWTPRTKPRQPARSAEGGRPRMTDVGEQAERSGEEELISGSVWIPRQERRKKERRREEEERKKRQRSR